jgi:AbiV family abortive infection protein
MSEETQLAIQQNITSLFDAAELLVSNKYYGPAIHLIMAAREESVKWMLVHCWDHLDQNTQAKIFRHDFKHRTSGIFYFLSGQLQAMDLFVGALELLKDKNNEISDDATLLIENLPKTIDDRKNISETIMISLQSVQDESEEIRLKRDQAIKDSVDAAETLRQNSIYVDFDRDLKIKGAPQQYGKNDYLKIRRDVVLAKYHMDKLAGLNPNKDVLHSTFPEWKAELEERLRDLARSFADNK